jgi:histidine phosphotransferase ChpT
MSTIVDLAALDLAALVASRVCHDVISPVGAIVNGLEILEDEKDEEMRGFALDLVKKSARQASARLQFARLAFGAAGSAGAQLDTGDAEQVTRGFLQDSKTSLEWTVPRVLLPKEKVKLLLNLVVLAVTTIPRGGTVRVSLEGEGDAAGFRLDAEGQAARVPVDVEALIAGTSPHGRIDAHVIQPFYTGLLAREAGMGVTMALDGERVTILASPLAQPVAAEAPATLP